MHDAGLNQCIRVKLDLDARYKLGMERDKLPLEIKLEITKAGWLGSLWWFLTVRDPSIRIAAILSVVSVALGVTGLIAGIVS